MARLTQVYNSDESGYVNIGRRHLPLVAGDKLMMLMDLNSKGLVIDSPQIRGRELEEFTRKFTLLTPEELRESLIIDSVQLMSVLNQCVQCVGCRRRVERLFYQLTLSGHPTLDPLVLNANSTLSITEDKLKTPQALGTLLYRHHEVLNNLLDSKLRNKTRCILHSLDAFRAKPFSETWREVWVAMKNNCRDELTVIETKELHEVLDNYLKKHKFCTGCRTKIEKAYKILIGELPSKEKGFIAALYLNIRKCVPDQHIHVSTNKIDFLDALIKRAEPEVNGSYSKLRERHAKTLEIAQEEVLTCVGMIMYERLRRIYISLREEERACQVLAAIAVHALCRSFDTFVEQKQGISNLELLYQEISRAEKAKELKREQKKLKKKKKKNEKKNMHRACDPGNGDNTDYDDGDMAFALLDADDDENEIILLEADYDLESICSAEDASDAAVEHNADNNIKINNSPKTKIKKQKPQTEQVSKPKKKKKQKSTKSGNAKLQRKQFAQQEQQQKLQQKQPPQLSGRRNSCSSNDPTMTSIKCDDCLAPAPDCPCERDVRESGYGSEPNSHANSRMSSIVSSPEGSEVSCLDGLCNHELDEEPNACVEHCEFADEPYWQNESSNPLSLLQTWKDLDECNEDDGNCYIPQEVVDEYQCQQEKIQTERKKLRARLRANFERLCAQRGVL